MSKIEDLAEREASLICEALGLYVYEVEYVKEGDSMCLRVYIDSDDGITLTECEAVSRALEERLDALDPIAEPYDLEVSSPGVERRLSRPWHFEKAIGKKAAVHLFEPIGGTRDITGVLTGAEDTRFVLAVDGRDIVIDKQKASQIKLVFEF